MNSWVGGSDPEAVGDACFSILSRHLKLDSNAKLLDFGCGIGRVALSVLKHRPQVRQLVGLDIMPQVVDFCRSAIETEYPNTRFEAIEGSNDHYDGFVQAAGARPRLAQREVIDRYRASFTGSYAFSVFTHLERADFQSALRFVQQMLEPGGEFLFTCFLITPGTRAAIVRNECLFVFRTDQFEEDGSIFVGNPDDRLGFIAFDQNLVEQMVHEAGLVVTHTERGSWPGTNFSGSLQDVVVCRKPRARAGSIQRTPTVDREVLGLKPS